MIGFDIKNSFCRIFSIVLLCFYIFPFNFLLSQSSDYPETRDELFQGEEILQISLVGNIKELMKDRREDASYHPMKIFYKEDSITTIFEDVKVKVRGNFRRLRENCKKPPLTLNFDKDSVSEASIFHGQNKLKLVVPCVDEKHAIREYLVYKMYNIITEYSFRVRLIKLIYVDTHKKETSDPQYAFLIEDEDQMAARNESIIYKINRLHPKNLYKDEFHKMAVFAYMIGNTDWSVQYRHNIKLIYKKEFNEVISVPYDFDLSGIVGSPYAKPAEALRLRSVKHRRYRGYCLENIKELDPVFDHFKSKKRELYQLYQDCTLLEEDYVKSTLKYLDKFYQTLEEEKKYKKDFLYPCDEYGTGNIVLKGM